MVEWAWIEFGFVLVRLAGVWAMEMVMERVMEKKRLVELVV
jgi:hypothetical protein